MKKILLYVVELIILISFVLSGISCGKAKTILGGPGILEEGVMFVKLGADSEKWQKLDSLPGTQGMWAGDPRKTAFSDPNSPMDLDFWYRFVDEAKKNPIKGETLYVVYKLTPSDKQSISSASRVAGSFYLYSLEHDDNRVVIYPGKRAECKDKSNYERGWMYLELPLPETTTGYYLLVVDSYFIILQKE